MNDTSVGLPTQRIERRHVPPHVDGSKTTPLVVPVSKPLVEVA
jgi:hypothetical protein